MRLEYVKCEATNTLMMIVSHAVASRKTGSWILCLPHL